MRRSWAMLITIAIATLMAAATGAEADEPLPALGRNTAINAFVRQLEDEIETIRAQASSDERSTDAVARAGVALRIIALDLLTLGRDQPDGAIAVMAGWSIAEARDPINALLRDAAEEGRLTAAHREQLETFADEAVTALHELDLSPPGLDRGLGDLLHPLAVVVASLEDASVVNHWVELPTDNRDDQPANNEAQLKYAQQHLLDNKHAATLLDEEWRANVRDRLDQLRDDLDHPTRRAEAQRQLEEMIHLAQLVETASALRAFDRNELPRAWRTIDARLDDARRRLDERVSRSITRALTRDDAQNHADLVNLLEAQQRLLTDRRRLRQADGWIESVRRVNAPAANGVERELRILARDLTRPTRRNKAAQTLDQFEREVRWLDDFAFETTLRRGCRVAQTVTHSRADALLDAINRARRAWTEARADGETASDAAARLGRLARLMSALDTLADPAADDELFKPLERWAGWMFDRDLLQIERRRLLGRLKLAVAHAVDGNRVRLINHLDAINETSDVIRLGERLHNHLKPALIDLPGGATAMLGRVMCGPTDRSALAEHRETLAQIGWITREADHARAEGDIETANRLSDWRRRRIAHLLETVSAASAREHPNQ